MGDVEEGAVGGMKLEGAGVGCLGELIKPTASALRSI